MTSSERVVLMVFGLALFVTSGSALRCWVCSSNVNSMCGDPMNTTDHQAAFHIRDCTEYGRDQQGLVNYGSGRRICRKIVKRVYGDRVIMRQCGTPAHDEGDIVDGQCGSSMMVPRGHEEIESCHICSTELCNSATNVSTMRLLYAGAMILFIYTFYESKQCVL